MYPNASARAHPDRPCIVMATSGEVISYGELDRRANRLAHLLRRHGLKRLDHISIFMENHSRYIECCSAAERAGLYYTCINSFLTDEEARAHVGEPAYDPATAQWRPDRGEAM